MERLRQETRSRYKLCRCPCGSINLSRNVQMLDCGSHPLNGGVDGGYGEMDQRELAYCFSPMLFTAPPRVLPP